MPIEIENVHEHFLFKTGGLWLCVPRTGLLIFYLRTPIRTAGTKASDGHRHIVKREECWWTRRKRRWKVNGWLLIRCIFVCENGSQLCCADSSSAHRLKRNNTNRITAAQTFPSLQAQCSAKTTPRRGTEVSQSHQYRLTHIFATFSDKIHHLSILSPRSQIFPVIPQRAYSPPLCCPRLKGQLPWRKSHSLIWHDKCSKTNTTMMKIWNLPEVKLHNWKTQLHRTSSITS